VCPRRPEFGARAATVARKVITSELGSTRNKLMHERSDFQDLDIDVKTGITEKVDILIFDGGTVID